MAALTQLTTLHPLDVLAAESRYTRLANGIRPPTRLRGYVEDAAFDGILADVLELVPDVAWPTSIQTYQSMRRDPKLTAILDGYSLQLRRAQWQLDGTGCRPEVVDLVADDMDLPVKGADRNGAARTRGVSWHEHLRSALTMLTFGHAGFELEAAIVDGKARLVGLWDRPQHTIHTIHVEPRRGTFNGISQILGKVAWDEPEIRPERLAWYAHQREGAQWFGTALIRPAFAPWLLKREMQRVLATSSRRFGMGVPTVEWAPTAAPSPQQFSEAQKAVSASRVGDQSGMTMPPGALLRLVGMSGGTPDTLSFIKWLDQQMSASALMGHLDLGQTETGSRALGQSLIEAWTLALEAIGEEVADVATRQVAARIVGWNWGDQEPVPRVVVSGVGSRREVTAESLKLLLDSGALDFDPGLAEWVRREWRLPARTTPRPTRQQVAASAREIARSLKAELNRALAADPPPQVEAAAKPIPQEPTRYEQPELPITAQGEDEPDERDDEMRQVDQDHAAALAALLAAWPVLAAPLATILPAEAAAHVTSGSIAALGTLAIPAGAVDDITSGIAQAMVNLGAVSTDRAHASIRSQGVDVDLPELDTSRLRQQAEAAAQVILSGYRSAAARAALGAAGPDPDPEAVADAVRGAVGDLTRTAGTQTRDQTRGFVAGELGSALQVAIHLARAGVFRTLQAVGVPVTWVADESNDDRNRCKPCTAVNGTQYTTLAEALAAYPAGKYVGCLGRQRCRGQLRARIGRNVVAFNPRWKDQPRWPGESPAGQGGRWREQAGGGAPDVGVRKPSTRKPGPPVPPRGGLAGSVKSGISNERSLIDGPLGQVDLVTFGDGTRAVRKTADETEADVEELAALVAEALGVRAPKVHRAGGDTTLMEYMTGTPAVEVVGHWRDAPSQWTDSDDGRLLGLLDLIIDNQDRHNENWLVNNGRIEAIDHNFAYQFQEAADEAPRPRSDFENHFIDESDRRRPQWADNDLSPQDVAKIRQRLAGLRGEYVRLGRGDWHEWTLARLDAVGAHARGRRSRLP